MIWAVWHGTSSSWKYPSQDGYTVVIKGYGHVEQQYSYRLWHVNDAQFVLSGSNSAKNISPTHYSLSYWYKTGWMHAFMLFTPNSAPAIWMSQQKSRLQIRQPFSNLLLSSFGEPVWIVALFPLFLADRSGTLCSSAALAHLLQGSMCCAFRDALMKYWDQLTVVWLRGA